MKRIGDKSLTAKFAVQTFFGKNVNTVILSVHGDKNMFEELLIGFLLGILSCVPVFTIWIMASGKGVDGVTAYNCWRCGRVYNSDLLKRCPLCGADLKEPEKKC